jgi:hypothetical protein
MSYTGHSNREAIPDARHVIDQLLTASQTRITGTTTTGICSRSPGTISHSKVIRKIRRLQMGQRDTCSSLVFCPWIATRQRDSLLSGLGARGLCENRGFDESFPVVQFCSQIPPNRTMSGRDSVASEFHQTMWIRDAITNDRMACSEQQYIHAFNHRP